MSSQSDPVMFLDVQVAEQLLHVGNPMLHHLAVVVLPNELRRVELSELRQLHPNTGTLRCRGISTPSENRHGGRRCRRSEPQPVQASLEGLRSPEHSASKVEPREQQLQSATRKTAGTSQRGQSADPSSLLSRPQAVGYESHRAAQGRPAPHHLCR